ncbi:metal-sensitive transcriptional regulator [Candidatus Kaiserbacteria bacterium]|nr:metal-sensitive transcriptional regulator [Candidatus Kaiserbacteria bacterium]
MVPKVKKQALQRLKIILGQVKGLAGMVEKEKYCVDIIVQSSAIKKALSGVEDLVLKNHLDTHVMHQMRTGKGKRAAEEILKVYRLAQRKA